MLFIQYIRIVPSTTNTGTTLTRIETSIDTIQVQYRYTQETPTYVLRTYLSISTVPAPGRLFYHRVIKLLLIFLSINSCCRFAPGKSEQSWAHWMCCSSYNRVLSSSVVVPDMREVRYHHHHHITFSYGRRKHWMKGSQFWAVHTQEESTTNHSSIIMEDLIPTGVLTYGHTAVRVEHTAVSTWCVYTIELYRNIHYW